MTLQSHTLQTRHGAVRLNDTGGDGFPLLLVHGSGSSRHVFERQMDSRLAQSWRMIALDLPGHGQSANAADPAATYTTTGFAQCIEDCVHQLGLSRLAVYGWSLGGHVAIEFMARGDRVAGLMLTGAPPVSPGMFGMLRGFHPSFDLLLASKDVFSDRDADRFERLCFGDTAGPSVHATIMRADGRARAAFSRAIMRGEGVDQRRAIEQSSVPVALVTGSEDPFVRQSYLAGLDIPLLFDGAPITISGAGHAPFWERPEIFNPVLDRFLTAVVMAESSRSRLERRIAG